MFQFKTVTLSLTIGALLALGCVNAQESETSYDVAQSKIKLSQGIVASYKGGQVTEEEFTNKVKSIPWFQRGDPMNQNDTSWKNDIVKNIVVNKVLAKNALKDKLDKEADFLKAYREEENKQLLDILFQKEVKDKSKPSETEIEKYYSEHKTDFSDPESIKIRYLFVDTYNTRTTESQKKEAFQKINEAYKLLEEGKPFVDVAKEYSEVEEARRGEAAGPFFVGPKAQKRIARVLEETALSLKVGSFSSIMTTDKGYHIIYLEEHKLAYQNPLAEVKDQIQKILESTIIKERVPQVISSATTGLDIESHPEYLTDTAIKPSMVIISMPDYKLTVAEFEESVLKTMGPSSPEQKVRFLDSKIRNQALALYARKLKIDKAPELNKVMKEFKDQYLGDRWIKNEVNKNLKVTDKMVQDFYNRNTSNFMTPKEYLARNIYIKAGISRDTPPADKAKLLTSARETAEMALNDIQKGLDFATTAQKYSTIPNAKDGGFIGWYSMGPMGHVFDLALGKLTTGQHSDILDMRDGYQIITLEDTREPKLQSFDEVKEKARQMAENEERVRLKSSITRTVLKDVKFQFDSSRL